MTERALARLVIVDGAGCALSECLHPRFSVSRRAKIERLKTEEGRVQSACAELALLLLTGGAPYRYGENDKPEFARAEDGHLSFSHAGSAGACAWANVPMGMDMEREERDLSAIRRRIVSPEEAEGNLTEAWCVKEAYVKKTGEGLIVPFPSLTAKDGKLYSPRGTAFYKTGALCGYRYALCADVPFERSVLRVNAREAVRAIDEAGERPAFETVTVTVDRPLGAVHPSHADIRYPVNYGYIKGLTAGDGEAQDAYILGVSAPLCAFTGRRVAVIHRRDDEEDKWVVAPDGMLFTEKEIRNQTAFQERYFDTWIERKIHMD